LSPEQKHGNGTVVQKHGNGTVVIPTKREYGSVGEGEAGKKDKVTQYVVDQYVSQKFQDT
jgi:hypothetical protein